MLTILETSCIVMHCICKSTTAVWSNRNGPQTVIVVYLMSIDISFSLISRIVSSILGSQMSNLHFTGSYQSRPKTLNANSRYKPKPAHKIFNRESYSPGLHKMIKYSVLPVTWTALKLHASHSSTGPWMCHIVTHGQDGARV